jgi:predicted acylesterase/phospholipase RssA
MIKNLVISGGAMRGFCFIGSIQYLEEKHIIQNIQTFTGTSIGGCLALLLNLNYSSKELIDIFININLEKYRDINIENILNFFENYGIDDGNRILHIFKILLMAKLNILNKKYNESITFNQLFNLTQKKLTIIGCCLNDMEAIYYNYETYPNMKILDALRITFSIPFIFKPITIKNKIYVDGGLINNYPIELYDKKTTLGLVSTSINIYNKNIENIEDFFTSVVFITYYNLLKTKIKDYASNTINIEYDVNSFDFELSKEEKRNLITYGYDKTKLIYNTLFKEEPIEEKEEKEPIETKKEHIEEEKEPIETKKEPIEEEKESIETKKESIETKKESIETKKESIEETKKEDDSIKKESIEENI